MKKRCLRSMPFMYEENVWLNYLGKKKDEAQANLFWISSNEMGRQFGQQYFKKNRQNCFSWTKSWQWTATVCPNATAYLTRFRADMQSRKQSRHQQTSSWNPESYRHIPQLCEMYHEAWSATQMQRDTSAGRVLTNGSLTNQLISGVTVVRVNVGHNEQLFWISCWFFQAFVSVYRMHS